MVGDRESQLYRDIADITEEIPKLKTAIEGVNKEITNLKSKHTKLLDKVNLVDIQGFQNQISTLIGRMDKLENSILLTKRYIAELAVEQYRMHLDDRLHQSFPFSADVTLESACQYFLTQSVSFAQEISHSTKPLSLATKFRTNCVEYCRKHKINVFIGD